MTHTAEEVRAHLCFNDGTITDTGRDMLRAYADLLERQAAGATDVPLGAIENGRVFADRLEATGMECEAGTLAMCSDWQEFRRCFEFLAEWAMNLTVVWPVASEVAQKAVRVEQQWSRSDKERAFEWLRNVATADDAPKEAGIALDTWHALAMAAAQPAERQGERIDPAANWPEDAGTENGDYECVCASCGRHFIGYKRRVTCHLCHTHPAAPVGVPDEMVLVPREPTEVMLIAARDWSHAKYGRPIGSDAAQGCWKALLAAAPSQGEQPSAVPDVIPLTDTLRGILGKMCFTLIHLANALRAAGYQIDHRAEDEQAVCLHWMLNLYLKHGDDWGKAATQFLEEAKAKCAAAPSAPSAAQEYPECSGDPASCPRTRATAAAQSTQSRSQSDGDDA